MGQNWSANTIKGALQARVVQHIINGDADLLHRLIKVTNVSQSQPTDWSDWSDLAPAEVVLCQLCLVILGQNAAVTGAELFRHLSWEDWHRVIGALCVLFEIEPNEFIQGSDS